MCIAGRDVIAQAQSGTGKTATFSVAILEKIDLRVTKCQALILAPTRELAQQVRTLSCVTSDGVFCDLFAADHSICFCG